MSEEADAKQNEIERLQELLRQQEMSAKMLVRRDRELQQAYEKLRELDRLKTEFISVAAHQLRTPLSAVKWALKLLLDGDVGSLSAQQKSVLLKGYESTERMINQVNNLLASERINRGKIAYAPVCLPDLVENMVSEAQKLTEHKQITFAFTHTSSFPYLTLDGEKMRAVLQNLIENAIKYSPEGGEIRIHLEEREHDVLVSVADDGIGIPRVEQDDIFTRFYRAKNAVKVETDGSGLGLFIARQIVSLHGGEIWFKSTEGKGTTFYFTLPKEDSDPAA